MKRLLSALVLSALCAVPLAAQDHPNQQRGFRPDNAYSAGEFDTVNAYNGNLTLTLPIGQTYPVGGNFSYQLKLVYNSNVWDYLNRQVPDPRFPGEQFDLIEAAPNLIREAGIGWTLSFGRLFDTGYLPQVNTAFPVNTCMPDLSAPSNAGWMYVDPSGAKHCFYASLHEGEPAAGGVFYTRDGSYLRLTPSTSSSGTIEFPDGTIHTFLNTWPTELKDRFGNFLRISGAGAAPWQGQSTWTLTDSVGRVHRVNFQFSLVSSVELQTFGQTAAGAKSVWNFDYALVQMIERPIKDTFTCFDPNNPGTPLPGCDRRAAVNMLVRVRPPAGNPWEMLTDAGQPAYNVAEFPYPLCPNPPAPQPAGCYVDPWFRAQNVLTAEIPGVSGTLASLRLPQRGRVAWRYMAYHLPAKDVKHGHRQRTAGVAERRLFEANGQQVAGAVWTYAQSFDKNPPWQTFNPETRPKQVVTTITDPLGHRKVHYFWAQWSDWQFGLPITPLTSDGYRYLSEEVFAAGKPVALQRTFLRFESDVLTAVSGPENQDWSNANRRVLAAQTYFEDGTYSGVTNSDFDGLGHYRTTHRGGNMPGLASRTEVVSYNNGVGTYNQPGYQPWPTSTPWILGTYIFTIAQPGSVFRTFCWDANTGVLKARRVHAAGAVNVYQANDLIEVFGRDAAGNVTSEKYFGGDTQSVGADATWICVKATSLATPVYQTSHTYSGGVRAASSSINPANGAVLVKTLDLVIDAATGLPSKSRDASGLATDYLYDAVGRMTRMAPEQEAPTDIGYQNAGGGNPERIAVSRLSGGITFAQERYRLDDFGRVAVEEERLPDSSCTLPPCWSSRFLSYNALGLKDYVTERGAAGPGGPGTRYINYDPLGRPGRIRPADGSAHDVDLVYSGVSQVERRVKVADTLNVADSAEGVSSTTEIYDLFGRLLEVRDPLGMVTRYEYDSLDHLTRVFQQPPTSLPTQERRFTYDNRGFLLWENHPEKDTNVFGQGHDVDYRDYDARGYAGRRIDGLRDLTFAYDKAGRPTLIRQTGAGFAGCAATFGPRCWKEFTYAAFNDGANRKQGKLETATRYNFLVLGGTPFRARVVETYTYAGVQGRTSARRTDHYIHNGATGAENLSERFDQSWQHTPAGETASRGYPLCTAGGCAGAGTPRSVSLSHSLGRLTAVPGYASNVTYHANGLANQVVHANLITDVLTIDTANLMRRPLSLQARNQASTLLWSSGTYKYDGSGNIKAIGSSRFAYDLASRLLSARIFDGAVDPGTVTTTKWQDYIKDFYGNVVHIAGTSTAGSRNIPTDTATNRLCGPGCGGTAFYDLSGNLTAWNGQSFEYDDLGMILRSQAGGQEWLHIYTAGDERLWSYQVAGGTINRWTLRDLDGKVLREYTLDRSTGIQTLDHDYVYAGNRLLAAQTSAGIRHYHLDHLGTPRLITNAAGVQVAFHAYYPFGEESTFPLQDTERMKFTGHERDFNSPGGTGDDLDYMHARFYNPLLGRFLSTDPVLGRLGQPQSWNRYAYVRNNPLLLVDPDGRSEIGGAVTLLLLGLEHGPLPKATLGITEKTLTLAGILGTGADTLADAQGLYHDGGSPLGIAGKVLSEIDNSFDMIGGSFALTSTWKGASVLAKIGRGANIAAAVIPTIIEIAHGTDPFTALANNFPNVELFFALIEPYTDAVTMIETRGPEGEFVDRGIALYHGDTPKPYLQYQWSQDVKGHFFRKSGARFNVVTYSQYHPPR